MPSLLGTGHAVVFIRSEVLCFTLNKYGKCLSKNLKVIISDFYSDDEIWSAKELLHSELSKVVRSIYLG